MQLILINETVLDCFMGSGSTGQAAKNLNPNFIGFELDNTLLKKFRKLCILIP
ncbi:DNA methyltransferase [Peribacillus sp. S4]|uniref:DNA methyltransferase n=1 Tax=Peribacillus sp. S4 TaxID=3384451 RepID=UPI00398A477F